MKYPLLIVLFALGFGIGYQWPSPSKAVLVGAALPSATASFETSLQSAITSSATTMTLTANAVRGGGALSGYNCFTIDEGSAQAETICGTVSATNVTGLTRGMSQSTGTTTVAALQFAHRRGANVKITDFPVIQIVKAIINGEDTFPNLLSYTAGTDCSGGHSSSVICTGTYLETYANNVISGGSPTSTFTLGGKVLLATQLQMSSSTDLGVLAPLVLQAKFASSSPLLATTTIVITRNNGTINPNFIATSSSDTYLFNASTTFAGFTTLTGTTSIFANSLTNGGLYINGLSYKWPTTRPTATTSIAIDSSGNVTNYRADWGLLASTTLSAPVASTTLAIGVTSTNYIIIIDAPAGSGGGLNQVLTMQFNGDSSGTNYSSKVYGNVTENTQNVANARLSVTINNTTNGYSSKINVSNPIGRTKTYTFQTDIMSGATAFADVAYGGGGWINTTQSIASVTFGSASTLVAGTRIEVYGTNQ